MQNILSELLDNNQQKKSEILPPGLNKRNFELPPVLHRRDLELPPGLKKRDILLPPVLHRRDLELPPGLNKRNFELPPVLHRRDLALPPGLNKRNLELPPVLHKRNLALPPGLNKRDFASERSIEDVRPRPGRRSILNEILEKAERSVPYRGFVRPGREMEPFGREMDTGEAYTADMGRNENSLRENIGYLNDELLNELALSSEEENQ